MIVLSVRNVNEALQRGLEYIYPEGVREESRAGPVLVSPVPVTTVYERPMERVLFSAARDANPFFHLFEALFYLAGRNDIKWLDQFVSDFSKRFAEPDGTLHGSYGFRWRKHFDMEGGGNPFLPDQLETVIKMLVLNPQDRQAVITMWDPVADLGIPGLKDRPCNTHIYLRIRGEEDLKCTHGHDRCDSGPSDDCPYCEGVPPVLDMQVNCRSNDLVWGAYGANAVHFSVLQEYLAARIGVGVGKMYQVSFNYHAYTNVLDGLEEKGILEEGANQTWEYPAETTPIVTNPNQFDTDLGRFMDGSFLARDISFANSFFPVVACPMIEANAYWKQGRRVEALECLRRMPPRLDWRLAAEQWMQRRMVTS